MASIKKVAVAGLMVFVMAGCEKLDSDEVSRASDVWHWNDEDVLIESFLLALRDGKEGGFDLTGTEISIKGVEEDTFEISFDTVGLYRGGRYRVIIDSANGRVLERFASE